MKLLKLNQFPVEVGIESFVNKLDLAQLLGLDYFAQMAGKDKRIQKTFILCTTLT